MTSDHRVAGSSPAGCMLCLTSLDIYPLKRVPLAIRGQENIAVRAALGLLPSQAIQS